METGLLKERETQRQTRGETKGKKQVIIYPNNKNAICKQVCSKDGKRFDNIIILDIHMAQQRDDKTRHNIHKQQTRHMQTSWGKGQETQKQTRGATKGQKHAIIYPNSETPLQTSWLKGRETQGQTRGTT